MARDSQKRTANRAADKDRSASFAKAAAPVSAAAPPETTVAPPSPSDQTSRNGYHRPFGAPFGTPAPVASGVSALPRDGDREARRRRVAEAAYYRAERRGFAPGADLDDWLEAEKEIESSERGSEQP